MKNLALYFLIALFAASCNDTRGKIISKNENNGDPVLSVASTDEAMNRAIDTAKSSYAGFLKTFEAERDDTSKSFFSVKMRFTFGEGRAEHMWFNELHFKKDKLYGILDNDPVDIKNIKAGDTLEIKPDLVSDWMYIEKGRLVGGYTLKALYDKMTPQEQQELEGQVGAKIR